MPKHQQEPNTPSRLRHDIDTGKGRDKIAYPDPAAAPLGTDDEAAGTPVTGMQTQLAHQNEICDRAGRDDAMLPDRAHQGQRGGRTRKRQPGLLIIGLALLVMILAVLFSFT